MRGKLLAGVALALLLSPPLFADQGGVSGISPRAFGWRGWLQNGPACTSTPGREPWDACMLAGSLWYWDGSTWERATATAALTASSPLAYSSGILTLGAIGFGQLVGICRGSPRVLEWATDGTVACVAPQAGPQGVQGPQGAAGAAGSQGATGAKGDKGDTGSTGATGSPGSSGAAGANGADGIPRTIQDEGTPLTQRLAIDFVGAGVTVTDDVGGGRTVVTVPGGGDLSPAVLLAPDASARNAIQPTGDFKGLTIRASGGQSQDLFQVRRSDGFENFTVGPDGSTVGIIQLSINQGTLQPPECQFYGPGHYLICANTFFIGWSSDGSFNGPRHVGILAETSSYGYALRVRDSAAGTLSGVHALHVKLDPVTSAPFACSTDAEGETYYNSTAHLPCICNGTSWLTFAGAPGVC